ncbi:sugar polymerase [Escherichia albertii]|uniref:sugar polymerase n=1 Tax=Escherichia albertii TaxID=208962 RepID=UPI00198438F6|nr:sugar polymerase [Escherichia albertii]MCU7310443.1 sugar polymerase [Escherichia albertii]MCZ8676058.1 sugar polymerase [Escherichia albertii]MCZ8811748.1 sugar polymerase [Escherichia albertii]WDB45015.1 sugar polymerase [Escherichia albertii]
MNIYIVVCVYTLSPAYIKKWFKLHLHNTKYKLIIVDNNLRRQITDPTVIIGTNTLNEFSAYNEGLQLIKKEFEDEYDIILMLNDTLFTRHNAKFFLKHLLKYKNTVARLSIPAICGRIDPYNNICYRNPWSNDTGYISSFCIIMNKPARDLYLKLLSDISPTFPFADSVTELLNWSTHIDRRFKEFVISHLIDTDTATVWYQSKNNIKNIERLNVKGKCVFLEHYVSGNISKHGVLVSIFPTWKQKTQHFIYEQIAKMERKLLSILKFKVGSK